MLIPCPRHRADRFAPSPWLPDHPDRLRLEQRLAPDHLARTLGDAVGRLDLAALLASYGPTGSPAHRPDAMLAVVLYELRAGRHSPAQWYRDARELEPVRWLLRGAEPSRSCWYAFRDRVADYLDDWLRQVLAQAQQQGMTPARRGALDGTTVAANAARRRLANEATLERRASALEQVEHGTAPTPRPGWIAPTACGRRRQQRQLQKARQCMAQRQASNRGKRASKRRPPEKIVLSIVDPEAAVSYDKEGVYRPLYNVQILDDLDSPLVLAYDVFAQPNDAGLLGPMVQRARQALGHGLDTLLADTAYAGGADVAVAERAGVRLYAPLPAEPQMPAKQLPKSAFTWLPEAQTYQCPHGQRLVAAGTARQKRSGSDTVLLHQYRCPPEHCRGCPLQAACTPSPEKGRTISRSEHEEVLDALRQRMADADAKPLYRLRAQTVELVNADWKGHRNLRRFSGRGRKRARCQVGLLVLAHNLFTVIQGEARPKPDQPPIPTTATAPP